MSLKKDNYKSSDKKIMNFAINIAKNNKYLTGSNPSVGCVIVKNNKILSFATTNNGGRPHAESIALNKNIYNKGTSLYSTLEPCSHHGVTPPCTNAIIKNKVKRVYYSIEDKDLRTFNKTKKILKSKKIITISGLQKQKVNNLYKEYNYVRSNKAPYVIGKIASSSNLNILRNNSFITNVHSRRVSHILRFQNHAILTSYKTINSDNPNNFKENVDISDNWDFPNINKESNIDIITWNCEFFPTANDSTIDALSEAITDLSADIIAFQEIKNRGWFGKLMNLLPEYNYIISQQSSFMDQAIIYKKNDFSLINRLEIFSENDYNFAGRPPLKADFMR